MLVEPQWLYFIVRSFAHHTYVFEQNGVIITWWKIAKISIVVIGRRLGHESNTNFSQMQIL